MSGSLLLRQRRALPLLMAASLCLLAGQAQADERILAYASEITVFRDSSLEVRETIRVHAEGVAIRRGIYRDFPTSYTDRDGRRVTTGFQLLSMSRDGRPEPYRTERQGNGVRVYAGEADVFLTPGEYTYELRYRTDRQLGFFADHDELYWNVTGNGWGFPIESATANVYLPSSVPTAQVRVEAYTGPQGARGTDYRTRVDDSTSHFATTAPLAPHEGLTIVVSWPKGHVAAPTRSMAMSYAVRDSLPLVIAGSGLLALIVYYIGIWFRVGRDPPARIVVPHYQAPQGQSPAAMRYLMRMVYDDRCFAAGVLSLAVKGHLVVAEEKTGLLGLRRQFVLTRKAEAGAKPPAPDEAALLQQLFARGPRLELQDANHAIVSAARSGQRASLKQQFTSTFFHINGGWHALGIAMSVAIVALTVYASVNGQFPPSWFLFTLPGQVAALAALLALLANGIFGRLLKAPTIAGRGVMDHIEGFKLYLDVAEGEELKLQGAPALTAGLFETHLPAALALGVEQRWAERFAGVFATHAPGHAPAWYQGERWDSSNLSGFSSRLGSSLDSAISSAATAPGSSSGSGGGGSSGGGGGGGGGGGW